MPDTIGHGIDFDAFTETALGVSQNAESLARRHGHTCVDTEHLLYALLFVADGKVLAIFQALDFDRGRARIEMHRRLGAPDRPSMDGRFSPSLLKAFQQAFVVADFAESLKVDAEHLLLALLRDEEDVAAKLLINWGITRERIFECLRQPS